jgi:hypothetical protein
MLNVCVCVCVSLSYIYISPFIHHIRVVHTSYMGRIYICRIWIHESASCGIYYNVVRVFLKLIHPLHRAAMKNFVFLNFHSLNQTLSLSSSLCDEELC